MNRSRRGHILRIMRPVAPATVKRLAFGTLGRANVSIMQCVIELQASKGIPYPLSVPPESVVGRRVRICLLERFPDADG